MSMWKFLRPWLQSVRGRLVVAGLCAMVVGVAVAAQPLIIKMIIDDGLLLPVANPDPDVVRSVRFTATATWVGIFMAISLARIAVWSIGYRQTIRVLEEVQRQMRTAVFRHVQRLCLRYHDRMASGELFNAIMGSPIAGIKQWITEWTMTVPYQFVAGAVAISALSLADPVLTAITVVLAMAVAWSSRGSRAAVAARSKHYLATEAAVSRRIGDLLHGVRETKLQAQESAAEQLVTNGLLDLHAQGRALAEEQHRYNVRPETVRYIAHALLCLAGGWRCLYGEVPVGVFVAFLMVFDTLMQPLLTMLRLGMVAANARSGAERINAILAEESSTPEPAEPQQMPAPAPGVPAISCQEVHFSYGPDRPVLTGLSIDIAQGQSVALVGASGSGKSTLVSLLMRMYDVDAGEICLHGMPIQRGSLQGVRSAFAVVPQAPYIFARSVRENVTVSAPQATDADIWIALEQARLDDVVRALPQGLDAICGDGGNGFSGGQKQRLAIARALLTKAPFIILDEATSALDNHAEQAVQDALQAVMRGRTTIIIAHRLSSIRNVDRIVVMEHGHIVQDGTYDTLATTPGPFYHLLHAARQVA